MTLDDREAILDRWARRDAAKAIAAELGISSLVTLYRIVAEARERHDPRATFRKGRESAGRPTQDKKLITRAARRALRCPDAPKPMTGWWFGKRTVWVTTLGTGSADCQNVPVSVSDVLRGPPETVQSASTRPSPAKSFREALADWPHQKRPEAI